MRPGLGEVLHFSEDAGIGEFVPRRAPTQNIDSVHVWAVDAFHSPSYWFPRDCPRVMVWRNSSTTVEDAARLLGRGVSRVHAIEYGWLEGLRTAVLFAYRFDALAFRELESHGAAMVCDHAVRPLGPPTPVNDLIGLHEEAEIELRVKTNLWGWWNEVVTSTLGFSGIRLRNAAGGRTRFSSTEGRPAGTDRRTARAATLCRRSIGAALLRAIVQWVDR